MLTALVLRLWDRFRHARWRAQVQAGIMPVTVGLVAASALLITEASNHTSWSLYLITALVTLASLRTRLHPLWLLAAGGLLGLTGIGQG
jgi:chromate transporter